MSRDPVMEALEETKELEAAQRRLREAEKAVAALEAIAKAKPYTVARLLADLGAKPTAMNPLIADFQIEMEGCDCVGMATSMEVSMSEKVLRLNR